MGAIPRIICPTNCPALMLAQTWLPCQPRLLERPQWELQRLMLETGRFNLTGVGECMYPSVQPGDRMIPHAQPIEDFRVGQVAVIRRYDQLFAHRVIAVGADQHGAYIVTQGDNHRTSEGPSYAEDVVGVVRTVLRGNRQLAEEELAPRPPGIRLWRTQPRRALFRAARAALGVAQRIPGYRPLAGIVFRAPVRRMVLDAHLPLGLGALSALLRRIDEPDLSTFQLKPNDDAFLLRATQGQRMHARLRFVRARDTLLDGAPGCVLGGWWLAGLDIGLRWARCGVEERLLHTAAGILTRSGVETLWVREVPQLESFWRRWPVIEQAANVPARRVPVRALSERV